jgi:hypothetical protein
VKEQLGHLGRWRVVKVWLCVAQLAEVVNNIAVRVK